MNYQGQPDQTWRASAPYSDLYLVNVPLKSVQGLLSYSLLY